MSRYIAPSELIILATFSLAMCGYFHVLFHQKMANINNVQIQVLISIRDMLAQKLNTTTKIIHLREEECSELEDEEVENESVLNNTQNEDLQSFNDIKDNENVLETHVKSNGLHKVQFSYKEKS
jgi:hypothetical protein